VNECLERATYLLAMKDEGQSTIMRQSMETLFKAADALSELDELVVDAKRWRALMQSDRIRVVGKTTDLNHIGVEFWRSHPAAHPSNEYPQESCRANFTAYVDAIL
jgi:hypothetical protein